ncbi:MAG: UDP-N-acetylmuramate dehydrogenase [Tepidisphaerales bacterium]
MRIHQSNPFAGLDGCVSENMPLARFTWFRLGGPAQWYVRPRSLEELQAAVLRCRENGISIRVLGLGANLLVSDEGVDGAVFRFSEPHWTRMEFAEDRVELGAGVDLQKLVAKCVRQGRAGLECLAGIPGTIGGGVRMNAGGRFGDLGASVRRVTVMDTEGTVYERERDDLVFEYRRTNISAAFILDATLELDEDAPERILRKTKEIWMYKKNTQPLNNKSAGCIFKNPAEGRSAGALIDQAGLKGLRIGGAEVSPKHANFIVAYPGCKSSDVHELIKVVRQRVLERYSTDLQLEVQIWP